MSSNNSIWSLLQPPPRPSSVLRHETHKAGSSLYGSLLQVYKNGWPYNEWEFGEASLPFLLLKVDSEKLPLLPKLKIPKRVCEGDLDGRPRRTHWQCLVACFLRTPFGQLQTPGQANRQEGSAEAEEEGEIRNSSFFFVSRYSKFTNPSDALWVESTSFLL